jgi:subtilisin-like proprotein convertase family protein
LTDCNPNPITLDATLPIISTPPYFFSNTAEILISPVNTAIYSPIEVTGYPGMLLTENMLRSICLNVNITWLDDIDVYLQAPDGQILELTTDNGGDGNNYIETCFVVDVNAPLINAPGPYAPASAVPFTGDWLPEGDWSLLLDGQHPVNGTWNLILLDDQSGFTGNLIDWSMTFNSAYELQYAWTPEAGVSCPTCPITEVFPVENTVYQVVVSDSYGCAVSASTTIGGLAPEVDIQLNSPSCTATDMIDAAVTIQNGDIPYQIMWNTGDTLATL